MGIPAVFDEFRHHPRQRGGGNGVADAGRGPGRADDGAVHAHQPAVEIQQRASRIALVDGGVGLDDLPDEPLIGTLDDASQTAHHPGGERLVEAEGVSDRHHETAHFQCVRVPERQRLRIAGARGHLQHREIVRRIGADEPGVTHLAVGKCDLQLIRSFHHVVVGDDPAPGVVDESGTGALLGELAAEPVVALDLRGDVHDRRAGRPIDRGDPALHFDLAAGGVRGDAPEQAGEENGEGGELVHAVQSGDRKTGAAARRVPRRSAGFHHGLLES